MYYYYLILLFIIILFLLLLCNYVTIYDQKIDLPVYFKLSLKTSPVVYCKNNSKNSHYLTKKKTDHARNVHLFESFFCVASSPIRFLKKHIVYNRVQTSRFSNERRPDARRDDVHNKKKSKQYRLQK